MSDVMSDEKWENLELRKRGEWPKIEALDYNDDEKRKKKEEKEHLNKLVDDHWKYIEGVLWAASGGGMADESRIAEIGYHYKTAAKHFWGHCREFHVGETL